jgi:hypothetical protein
MKILWNNKDGGKESHVWVWGFESKRFGSVLLLKFAEGSREVYHNHAFNSLSFLLSGELEEHMVHGVVIKHKGFLKVIKTYTNTFHKVYGKAKSSWVLTFRGSWLKYWNEYDGEELTILTHGRKQVGGDYARTTR